MPTPSNEPAHRTFGQSTAQPGIHQPAREFGHGGGAEPSGGHRGFATGDGAAPTRHFGSASSPGGEALAHRESDEREGGPRLSSTGRVFSYNGHTRQRFAAERYHWPHGYAYRRYEAGRRLPHVFIVRDYYVDNYGDYGLADPPPNFEWIRYGPDLLLVDVDTGQIEQVVPGAFDETDAPPADDGSGGPS